MNALVAWRVAGTVHTLGAQEGQVPFSSDVSFWRKDIHGRRKQDSEGTAHVTGQRQTQTHGCWALAPEADGPACGVAAVGGTSQVKLEQTEDSGREGPEPRKRYEAVGKDKSL